MPPSDAPPSFAALVVRGAIWAGAGHYALFAFGIARAIILARIVEPELFGLVAGAAVWASYLGACRVDLRMAALGSAEDAEVLDTQFLLENLSAAVAFPAAGILFLLWPDVTSQTGWALLLVLLAAAQFEALTSTSVYLLDRRLRQDVSGRLTIVGAVTGFLVPVALALAGFPATALAVDAVWPMLLPRIGAVLHVRWRPGVAWTRTQCRRQLQLASTMWSIGLLGKITFQFDDWLVFNLRRQGPVVWRSAGVEPEALYDRAYSVSKLPMDLPGGIIAGNALAIYAERASHGLATLVPAYRRMTWALAWIIFASGTYLFVAADDVVYVLGERWVPMVPLLQLMILFIVGRPLMQNAAQAMLAVKRERDLRVTMAVQAALLAATCPPAVYAYGAAGAAAVTSVVSVAGVFVAERYVSRHLGQRFWPIYVTPACTACVAGAVILALGGVLPANVWASALLKAALCLAVFGPALWLLQRSDATDVWQAFCRGWRQA